MIGIAHGPKAPATGTFEPWALYCALGGIAPVRDVAYLSGVGFRLLIIRLIGGLEAEINREIVSFRSFVSACVHSPRAGCWRYGGTRGPRASAPVPFFPFLATCLSLCPEGKIAKRDQVKPCETM